MRDNTSVVLEKILYMADNGLLWQASVAIEDLGKDVDCEGVSAWCYKIERTIDDLRNEIIDVVNEEFNRDKN
jgi:hypothetical protein